MVDWAKYPLYRVKNIGGLELQCGLLRLLENIATHEAGVECSVILVINDASTQQEFAYEGLANKYNFIEKLLFRDNSGMDFGAYDLASLPSGLIP